MYKRQMPGYLPTIPAKDTRVVEEALADVAQTKGYRISYHRADMHTTGSTDFGDVSCIMPQMCIRDRCHPAAALLGIVLSGMDKRLASSLPEGLGQTDIVSRRDKGMAHFLSLIHI